MRENSQDPGGSRTGRALAKSDAGYEHSGYGPDADGFDLRSDAFPDALSRRSLLGVGGASLVVGASPASAARRAAAKVAIQAPRTHTLPSNAKTVHVGAMDPAAPIVLTVESGDIVHYPDTWVNWANEAKFGMPFGERESIRKKYPAGPYSLIGPVAVKGAEPGDVIECRMLKLRPISWGWNSSPRGMGALPDAFADPYLHYITFDSARRYANYLPGVRIPLAPFQAVMAVQPSGSSPVSGILSGSYGGNISLRELTEGSSLFLAVQVPGGRLWTGDSHAAQGDGVVDQTAIETAMEDLRIQYILHKKVRLENPIAETASHWITLGYGKTVDDALTSALTGLINWLSAATGIGRQDVFALASMAASFRITQYSNQTHTVYNNSPLKAVHAMMPKAIFNSLRLSQISRSLRPGT